jgi:hypothetical protein
MHSAQRIVLLTLDGISYRRMTAASLKFFASPRTPMNQHGVRYARLIVMLNRVRPVYLLLFAVPGPTAAAQNTGGEFWPEVGIYIQQGTMLRLEFVDFATSNSNTHSWQGNFSFYVNVALKPVFRRELRREPDVYRSKYLTFRGGYRYRAGLTNNDRTSENRGIIELTPRYRLPWQVVIIDRNRGEFRFIKGQSFSTRYRNRLWLERDFRCGWLKFTPYVYGEFFYDTRYDLWTPTRYAFGTQFPIGAHVELEPYYLRENGSHSNPPHVNAFGFKLNLYF